MGEDQYPAQGYTPCNSTAVYEGNPLKAPATPSGTEGFGQRATGAPGGRAPALSKRNSKAGRPHQGHLSSQRQACEKTSSLNACPHLKKPAPDSLLGLDLVVCEVTLRRGLSSLPCPTGRQSVPARTGEGTPLGKSACECRIDSQ